MQVIVTLYVKDDHSTTQQLPPNLQHSLSKFDPHQRGQCLQTTIIHCTIQYHQNYNTHYQNLIHIKEVNVFKQQSYIALFNKLSS